MTDASEPKIQAQIPASYIEYTINFASPVIKLGDSRGGLIQNVLEALKPHGFSLEGVETKLGSNKPSEHAMVFRRTTPKTPGLNIGLSYERIVVAADNVDWQGAPQLIDAIGAGINALQSELSPDFSSQQFILAMHVQIKDKSIAELMKALVTDQASQLVAGKPSFTGVFITGEKLTVTIEASVMFANSLWVRIIREHDPFVRLEEIAALLLEDEKRVFHALNLEEGAL
jgi:hypothetical protein